MVRSCLISFFVYSFHIFFGKGKSSVEIKRFIENDIHPPSLIYNSSKVYINCSCHEECDEVDFRNPNGDSLQWHRNPQISRDMTTYFGLIEIGPNTLLGNYTCMIDGSVKETFQLLYRMCPRQESHCNNTEVCATTLVDGEEKNCSSLTTAICQATHSHSINRNNYTGTYICHNYRSYPTLCGAIASNESSLKPYAEARPRTLCWKNDSKIPEDSKFPTFSVWTNRYDPENENCSSTDPADYRQLYLDAEVHINTSTFVLCYACYPNTKAELEGFIGHKYINCTNAGLTRHFVELPFVGRVNRIVRVGAKVRDQHFKAYTYGFAVFITAKTEMKPINGCNADLVPNKLNCSLIHSTPDLFVTTFHWQVNRQNATVEIIEKDFSIIKVTELGTYECFTSVSYQTVGIFSRDVFFDHASNAFNVTNNCNISDVINDENPEGQQQQVEEKKFSSIVSLVGNKYCRYLGKKDLVFILDIYIHIAVACGALTMVVIVTNLAYYFITRWYTKQKLKNIMTEDTFERKTTVGSSSTTTQSPNRKFYAKPKWKNPKTLNVHFLITFCNLLNYWFSMYFNLRG